VSAENANPFRSPEWPLVAHCSRSAGRAGVRAPSCRALFEVSTTSWSQVTPPSLLGGRVDGPAVYFQVHRLEKVTGRRSRGRHEAFDGRPSSLQVL